MTVFERYSSIEEEAKRCAEEGGFSPDRIRLLAVTKEQPVCKIEELYAAGIREFAENRLAVLEEKYAALPQDICWHWIGKLQSNKVRKVLKMAKVIHSVDSPELLRKIERIAAEENLSPELFIEVNVSGELSKSGIAPEALVQVLECKLAAARISGVMTMAPAAASDAELKEIFSSLYRLGKINGLDQFSMGMSNDFRIAAACGATVVRVGTAIFK